MPTIKIQVGKSFILFLAAVTLFTACTPAGPRALLRGQKLLEKARFPEAVAKLQEAVALLGNTNAQAFNYLGLACHHAGRSLEAEKAYQRALVLNPDLAEARYNLGCLWLEENRLEEAKAELTAYTLRRSNSAEGWCRLGTAQLRSGQSAPPYLRGQELAAAEKSFIQALHLSPQDLDTITGLGLVRLRRGNPVEAAQWFERALNEQPGYGPALLNLAIVQQQFLNHPSEALQTYRKYLSLKPAPENSAAVQELVNQLESPAVGEIPASAAPKTRNQAATNAVTAKIIGQNLAESGNSTDPVSRVAKSTVPEPPKVAPRINVQAVKAVSASNAANSSISNPPGPGTALTVEMVPNEPLLKSAQDASLAAPTSSGVPSNLSASPGQTSDPGPARRSQRTLLQRLNPANLFSADPAPRSSSTDSHQVSVPEVDNLAPSASEHSAGEASVPTVARYHYRAPAKPSSGNRSEAERAFAQAVQAHQAQRLLEAIQGYRRAGQLDPSFFDAEYNLGLAATESGNLPQALAAYENALALRPASLDARYNFALVLKQANYWLDAEGELEKLLNYYPNDSRAHLALGNLLAQQLHQPAKAREHYLKVLESDPRNPQAGAIRYWLTASPP